MRSWSFNFTVIHNPVRNVETMTQCLFPGQIEVGNTSLPQIISNLEESKCMATFWRIMDLQILKIIIYYLLTIIWSIKTTLWNDNSSLHAKKTKVAIIHNHLFLYKCLWNLHNFRPCIKIGISCKKYWKQSLLELRKSGSDLSFFT